MSRQEDFGEGYNMEEDRADEDRANTDGLLKPSKISEVDPDLKFVDLLCEIRNRVSSIEWN